MYHSGIQDHKHHVHCSKFKKLQLLRSIYNVLCIKKKKKNEW